MIITSPLLSPLTILLVLEPITNHHNMHFVDVDYPQKQINLVYSLFSLLSLGTILGTTQQFTMKKSSVQNHSSHKLFSTYSSAKNYHDNFPNHNFIKAYIFVDVIIKTISICEKDEPEFEQPNRGGRYCNRN